MTEVADVATTTTHAPATGLNAAEPATAAPPRLITEREVLMGSAVTLAGTAARTAWLRTGLRAFFASAEKPRPRRHYPKHHTFIENATMARMMDRL